MHIFRSNKWLARIGFETEGPETDYALATYASMTSVAYL